MVRVPYTTEAFHKYYTFVILYDKFCLAVPLKNAFAVSHIENDVSKCPLWALGTFVFLLIQTEIVYSPCVCVCLGVNILQKYCWKAKNDPVIMIFFHFV